MTGAATLVWMATEPPDAGQSRALVSWARAHGVVLALPPGPDAAALPMDDAVGDRVENLLDRAREALSAHDGEVADRALSTAESLLRAHPELPQAAWLMAEVERGKAERFRRLLPVDVEAAQRASRRADALDSGRVAAVGEGSSAAPIRPVPLELPMRPGGSISLWWDGTAVRSEGVVARPGPHAVVATWSGVPQWAAWIDTDMEGWSLRMGTAESVPPCSKADVARAHLLPGAPDQSIDASQVRCPHWIAAIAAAGLPAANGDGGRPPGWVRVALCVRGSCGTPRDWRSSAPAWWSAVADRASRTSGWSGWATASVIVAAVILAAGVTLLASGALQPAPGGTRFVNGGVKAQ